MITLAGEFGIYQKLLLVLFLFEWFILSFGLMMPVYIFKSPQFLCNGKVCEENNGGCVDKILKPSNRVTISTEFNLYCQRNYLQSVGISLVYIGSFFGMVIMGFISDNFGRKRTQIFGLFFVTIGMVGLPLMPTLLFIFVFNTIAGFSLFGTVILHFIIISEQFGNY